MTTLMVQFDETQNKIVSWFSAYPPIPEQFPGLGEVEASDPRYQDYYNIISHLSPGMPPPE